MNQQPTPIPNSLDKYCNIRWSDSRKAYVIQDGDIIHKLPRNSHVERILRTMLSLWDYYIDPDIRLRKALHFNRQHKTKQPATDAEMDFPDTLIALGADVEEAMNVMCTEQEKQMLLDSYCEQMKRKDFAEKYDLNYTKARYGLEAKLLRVARYLELVKRWDKLNKETS